MISFLGYLIIISLAILTIFLLIFIYRLGKSKGRTERDDYWQNDFLPKHDKKSRSVIGGNFSENLAPYLPDFPFLPTECRFIGKPLDFIVFKGMDQKKITEIIFVEVKSGDSHLSPQEKNLKTAIDKCNVKFFEYRVPKDLTDQKEEKIKE